MRRRPMLARQGEVISHYPLVEKIGEGGMGVVWKALDTSLGSDVALKTLPEVVASDPERDSSCEFEARILAALNPPNIVAIHAVKRGSYPLPPDGKEGTHTHSSVEVTRSRSIGKRRSVPAFPRQVRRELQCKIEQRRVL